MLPDSPASRVLPKLTSVKPAGEDAWMALCPAHDDRARSLSIRSGTDGRLLVKCHAGCATAAVLAVLGMTLADLFPAAARDPSTRAPVNGTRHGGSPTAAAAIEPSMGVTTRPKLVASYDYRRADGTLAFQTCRFEPKTFRQRRRTGNGEWVWNLQGVDPVLYRLPEIIEAAALKRTIYVVEGEKDADALVALGFAATTSPMGAGKWRESFSAVLAGTSVAILPDNDEPGRQHAAQVAASLTAQGATVRVVALPHLPEKGDVSDWLARGNGVDDLDALVGAADVWRPDGAPRRTRWRLDELWNNDSIMRPPPPVVPRLAWSGRSTLLAAREKSGKSTLVGYIAARVTHGDTFLGDPCAQGDVLLIGLEEFLGDAARRLRHFDADATRVHLVDGFLGDPRTRPQELLAHIDATDPVLVVIDSLAAYSHGLIQDDNNATQMASVVQPLTDLAHSRGVALVIVHHARKSDGRARGSTAITAGADVVCEFFTPEEHSTHSSSSTNGMGGMGPAADPTLRRMRSAGRVPVQPTYDVRFDGRDYVLAMTGELPVDVAIVATVRDRPGISLSDLCQAVSRRRDDVTRSVAELLAKRTLVNRSDSISRMKLVIAADANLAFLGDV